MRIRLSPNPSYNFHQTTLSYADGEENQEGKKKRFGNETRVRFGSHGHVVLGVVYLSRMNDFGISLDPSAIPHRHTLEDSDEENGIKDEAELILSPSTATLVKLGQSSYAIFAFGQAASIFATSFFTVIHDTLCQILSDSVTVFKDKSFPVVRCEHSEGRHVISKMFGIESKDGKTFSLCVHESRMKSQYCHNWCSKVCKLLSPEFVLILTSLKSYEYLSSHSQEHSPSCFLKGLHSSSWGDRPPLAVNLESPNTLIGEPAAVMTYCQLRGIPAAMVVCYTDSSLSAFECASAFQPVLSHSAIADSLVLKPEWEASQTIRKLVPKPREDLSNLYS